MKKKLALMIISAAAILPSGCSDRQTPVDVNQPAGLYYVYGFTSEALLDNVMQEFPTRQILIYTPPGYNTYDHRTRYPVLYLLHGFGGDQNYYKALYGLAETMDELINSGEIQPMIVVMPDASNSLGGGFYTNSPDTLVGYPGQSFAGRYADFITEEVIDSIDQNYKTIAVRKFRGISGHSMGGYGAVKLAMQRNDLFGSASSMSAPLAFNARFGNIPDSVFHGILTFFPLVFAENGFVPNDTAAYYAIAPGTQKRLTNMMFAMAASFSPHDPANPDSSVAHHYGPAREGRVDLPFRADGQLDSTVWGMWLLNDVSTMYLSTYAGSLDSTDLYVDAGSSDDLYFHLQSQYFGVVTSEVIDFYEIYPGAGGRAPADHYSLVSERLKSAARFHDQSFQPDFEQ
jgi:S-formylglutathione hydrolase FrmB